MTTDQSSVDVGWLVSPSDFVITIYSNHNHRVAWIQERQRRKIEAGIARWAHRWCHMCGQRGPPCSTTSGREMKTLVSSGHLSFRVPVGWCCACDQPLFECGRARNNGLPRQLGILQSVLVEPYILMYVYVHRNKNFKVPLYFPSCDIIPFEPHGWNSHLELNCISARIPLLARRSLPRIDRRLRAPCRLISD